MNVRIDKHLSWHIRGLVIVGIGLALTAAADAASENDDNGDDRLAVHDGDVVVFVGDQLTDAPAPASSDQYSVLVETFFTVRYPERHVRWVNAGWADDTAARLLLRLDRDVLAHQPNVVVICLGLNDPEYLPFHEDRLAAFRRDLLAIVQRCQDAGARTWLLSPPCVEENKSRKGWVKRYGKRAVVDLKAIHYNTAVGRYADTVRDVAETTQSGFVDWYQETTSAQIRAGRRNPSFALTRDGRTPTARSHAIAAAALLQAWGTEPIRVTIDLDWNAGSARVETHATDIFSVPIEITEDGRRILELNELPLPWPMAGGQREPLTDDWEASRMCRFLFRMPQPPPRGIILQQQKPDGTSSKPLTITAHQLRAGFDLTTIEPLRSSGAITKLFKLIGKKNYYRYGTWRKLQLSPPAEPELAEANRQLIAAWAAYVRGCEEIIFNRPKTFNARLVLAEALEPEHLPTRPPAKRRTPFDRPTTQSEQNKIQTTNRP